MPVGVGFLNHTGIVGGAEISLLALVEHVDRRHFRPVLIAPANGALLTDAARHCRVIGVGRGAELIRKPSPRHPLRFLRDTTEVVRQVAHVVRANKLDILHANSVRAAIIACMVRLIVPRLRVVVHVRDAMDYRRPTHVVAALITALGAQRIIAISGFVAQRYTRQALVRWLAAPKMTVVYNGLAAERFACSENECRKVRAQLGVTADAWPVIGVVGQLTPWKRQHLALEAFATLVAQGRFPNARLLIVGDAKFTGNLARYRTISYKEHLYALVQAYGLTERVVFTGERHDISAVMGTLDVSLLLSAGEPFGRVVIESMAAGTPVIAANDGGIPEIIEDGVSSWLTPTVEPVAIAAQITDALTNADQFRRVRAAGIERVRHNFDVRDCTARIEHIYARV